MIQSNASIRETGIGHVIPVNVETLKYSGKLYLPEKLYGREEEIRTLVDEISSIFSKRKKKNVTFISGISGIGKTGIVMEVSCHSDFVFIFI